MKNQNKFNQRLEITRNFNEQIQKPLIYVNQIGAQDHLVFDGNSFALNEDGEIITKLK